MRAVVQRSGGSRVMVDDENKGTIDHGVVVLLGIRKGDTPKDAEYLMDKIVNLRIFTDNEGKMNRSLLDTGGEMLLISQFTLYGDVRKGRRPSFTEAELPQQALTLFDYCISWARNMGIKTETGVFGADMQVFIENDGPVTILVDSDKLF